MPNLPLRIVYLAWLRERAGLSEESVVVPDAVRTVAGLIDWLRARGGRPAAAFAEPRALRIAVNQRFAKPGDTVAPGDEVAFFPPVTGG